MTEGIALYAIPHFLSCDAEQRYTREILDSEAALGMSSTHSYHEAVNWFLATYAEPRTLALAQDRFSRAKVEPSESIEAFSVRLRGLSENCGNIHTAGVLKKQFIQGPPQNLRTDAYIFSTASSSLQSLVTYISGNHEAAQT